MALYKYDIFIPHPSKKLTRSIQKVLDEARREILKFFGGVTVTLQRNKGFWKVGPITVKDEIQIWHVVSDKGRSGDNFLKKLRKKLEDQLKQKIILIIRHDIKQL